MSRVYNFSAGPAMLPAEVLQEAQRDLLNWAQTGASVMEISHRTPAFDEFAQQATADLRQLLAIPANYRILFAQGGARAQFAAVPLNILGEHSQADYFDSGYWSHYAGVEAEKFCQVNYHNILTEIEGKKAVLPMTQWKAHPETAYLYYCPNETLDGLAIFETPQFDDQVVVADLSSSILSQPIDISRYGIIFAGAQKNIGPSGITVIIVREDLLGYAQKGVPSVLDYHLLDQWHSMYNTPPTFAWYLSGLVFKWLLKQGGVAAIEQTNREKASRLYRYIDQSGFYKNHIASANRSLMNISFTTANEALDKQFITQAKQADIIGIKGHRLTGGMRASIYNAMDLQGINYLIDFMKDFERQQG